MPSHPDRAETELKLLQLLCQGVGGASVWPEALNALCGYQFAHPLNQVVFEVIHGIHSSGSAILKERVQRALVLAGFPGLDAAPYFAPHGLNRVEAGVLLTTLGQSRD